MSYFDSAETTIDQQRKAALEALARAGTEGKKAHEDEIARIQAAKQQAIQAALAQSAQRNAPQAVTDQIASQIGSQYDRQADNLRSSMASREAGTAALSGASDNYFSEARAAVPAMRARADRQLEQIRAKAAQDEEERQMRLMLSQIGLQKAGLDYETAAERAATSRSEASAKAAGKARGDDLSDSELKTRLLGAAKVRTEQAPAQVKNLSVFGVKLPQLSQPSIAKNAGIAAGLDPARVAGVLQSKPAAAPKAPSASQKVADMEAQAKLARMTIYNTAKRAASAETFKEFERALNPDTNGGIDPLEYVAQLSDSDLKKRRISRESLTDWVRRYMAV